MEGLRSVRRRERDDDGVGRKRHSLTVPICKDFVRGRCSRSHLDCQYAHPLPTVSLDGSDYILYLLCLNVNCKGVVGKCRIDFTSEYVHRESLEVSIHAM
jgi:hypothetical protein